VNTMWLILAILLLPIFVLAELIRKERWDASDCSSWSIRFF